MTVLTTLDVPAKKKKLSLHFVSYGNRSMTDVGGFGYVIFLFMFLGWLLGKNGYLWADHSKDARRNNSIEENDLWQNYDYTNASDNATCNATQLSNLIVHLLKEEELISGFNSWNLKEIAEYVVFPCILMQMAVFIFEIFGKMVRDVETAVHFAIIDAIRIVIDSTFSVGIYFLSTESWSLFQYMSYFLLFPNMFTLVMIYMLFIACLFQLVIFREPLSVEVIKTLKDTTRLTYAIAISVCTSYVVIYYYFDVPIVLVLMVLSVIFVAISLKDLFRQSYIDAIYFIPASIYLLLCLHTYGEMVIMTATASNSWDQHEKEISFKSLLWAIAIVSRYHLGSVFLGTVYVPFAATMDYPHKRWTNSSPDVRDYTTSTITRLLKMFIAVLGQNHMKAEGSIFTHLIKKRRSPPIVKSKSTEAWQTLLKLSITLRSINWAVIFVGSSLAAKLLVILVYVAVVVTVSYVIAAVDVIESTIQFCKIEEEGFNEGN